MNESLILKAALIIAVIGLVFLLLIVKITKLSEINIGEAKQASEEETVKITGVVATINARDDFTIMNIRKEENISIILFDNINLSKGQKVEVTGKVKDYNGEKELVAEKIVVLPTSER